VEQVCTEEEGSDRRVEKIVQWKVHNRCHSPLKCIKEIKLRSFETERKCRECARDEKCRGRLRRKNLKGRHWNRYEVGG